MQCRREVEEARQRDERRGGRVEQVDEPGPPLGETVAHGVERAEVQEDGREEYEGRAVEEVNREV